jgi:hypothetical protein
MYIQYLSSYRWTFCIEVVQIQWNQICDAGTTAYTIQLLFRDIVIRKKVESTLYLMSWACYKGIKESRTQTRYFCKKNFNFNTFILIIFSFTNRLHRSTCKRELDMYHEHGNDNKTQDSLQ